MVRKVNKKAGGTSLMEGLGNRTNFTITDTVNFYTVNRL